MDDSIIQFELPTDKTKNIIKVIGVGGGGGNAVRNMYRQGIKDVSFAICNTDSQALWKSEIPVKIQLGKTGLGAGGNPERAKIAAQENTDDIKRLFNDETKMVFITAGMGGGTGTGAAPIIAKLAKEMGLLTIGIVTIPFYFEKRPQIIKALEGVSEMRKNVDSLLIINNERLRDIYTDGITTAKDAFSKADDILTTATKGIAEIITIVGTISCDFCDVETIMKNGGNALMAIGKASGEKRLQKAIINALHSPLLSNSNIENAKKILFIIYTSEEHSLLIEELDELDAFMEELNPDIEVIWGLYDDNSLDTDVKITIIATGFEAEERISSVPEENKDQKYGDMIDRLYGKRKKPVSLRANEPSIQAPMEETEEPEEPKESGESSKPIDSPEDAPTPPPTKPSLAERLLQRFGNIIDEMTRDE